MMEEETSDTDLNNDSLELPVFSFTGLRSHTACDGAFDSKHRTPEHSNLVVIEGSDSDNCDPPLAKTSCSQTNPRHSVKCLPNEVVTIASSESDGDEDQDLVIPLAERLKRKLTKNQNLEKFDYSISKSSQENSKPSSLLKASIPSTCQISQDDSEIKETEAVQLSEGQDAGPVFVRRKAFRSHSMWDISDSDEGDEACKWQATTSHIPDLNSAQVHGRNACSTAKPASDSFQPQKKLKRNVVEIENARSDALRKQQQREQRKLEKENIQRQKEEEKVMRKELANIEKMFRPGECLKHMLVSIDPGLLQVDGGGQLLSTLQTMEVKCVIGSQTIPHSMTWRRRQACIAGQLMNEKTDWVDEPHVLIYIPLEEFVSMVYNSKQEVQGASTEGHTTLQSFAHGILQKNASRIPCFVVVELERYFRPQKKQRSQKKHQHTVLNEEHGRQRKAKGCDHHLPLISRADVELALVHLQLSVGTQFQLLETWKEFADYISMFTKAVAEAPFKKARENNGLSVYLTNDGSRGVKVDRSVNGLLCVWKKQIQQLNRVSSEMANAIVSVYQSPWSLKQAYQLCSSEREKENLLANIPVRRGEGTTSTTRRIGPELSKRIYLLMTSVESETFLE